MATLYKDVEGFTNWVIATVLTQFEHDGDKRYVVTVETRSREEYVFSDIYKLRFKEVLFSEYCYEAQAIRQSVHIHEEALDFAKHLEYLDYLFDKGYSYGVRLVIEKWGQNEFVRAVEYYARSMRELLPDESDEVLDMVQNHQDTLVEMLNSIDDKYRAAFH